MNPENSIAQLNTNTNTTINLTTRNKQCRICLQDSSESEIQMICPCRCEGSVRYVHYECIKKWMLTILRQKTYGEIAILEEEGIACELCKQKIHFIVKDTYEVRGCSEIINKIQMRIIKFIVLMVAIFVLIGIGAICFLILGNFAGKTMTQLIFICLGTITLTTAVFLVIALFYSFFINEDIDIKSIHNREFDKSKSIMKTTATTNKTRDLRIHIEEYE